MLIKLNQIYKRIRLNNYVQHLLNNITENNTIGMTQFKSIRKPNIRFPIKAPPLPKVRDNAAAITLFTHKK